MKFDRRRRLWETFGPEAFADPPISEQDDESTLTGSIVLGQLVAVSVIPILVWLSRVVLGSVDLLFVLLGWLLVSVAMIWILTARRKERLAQRDSELGCPGPSGVGGPTE